MFEAGLTAWGRAGGEAATRDALTARGVLPGADYRVQRIRLGDGTPVFRVPDHIAADVDALAQVEVQLRPVYTSRFRGEPPGGWPASVKLGGLDIEVRGAGEG